MPMRQERPGVAPFLVDVRGRGAPAGWPYVKKGDPVLEQASPFSFPCTIQGTREHWKRRPCTLYKAGAFMLV
jgi:hypothetical protein